MYGVQMDPDNPVKSRNHLPTVAFLAVGGGTFIGVGTGLVVKDKTDRTIACFSRWGRSRRSDMAI